MQVSAGRGELQEGGVLTSTLELYHEKTCPYDLCRCPIQRRIGGQSAISMRIPSSARSIRPGGRVFAVGLGGTYLCYLGKM